jgi:hypothetical protein
MFALAAALIFRRSLVSRPSSLASGAITIEATAVAEDFFSIHSGGFQFGP